MKRYKITAALSALNLLFAIANIAFASFYLSHGDSFGFVSAFFGFWNIVMSGIGTIMFIDQKEQDI